VTQDITPYTRSKTFSQISKKTELFAGFTNVAGGRGAAARKRGIPASYHHIYGFGLHTLTFINADNERYPVKFHFHSQQVIKNQSDA
jgi:catalase